MTGNLAGSTREATRTAGHRLDFRQSDSVRPDEDYGAYPPTWKADVARLAAEAVDIVWNPGVEAMYRDGFATRNVPEGPATAGLEDRFRPHFFSGVVAVVVLWLSPASCSRNAARTSRCRPATFISKRNNGALRRNFSAPSSAF